MENIKELTIYGMRFTAKIKKQCAGLSVCAIAVLFIFSCKTQSKQNTTPAAKPNMKLTEVIVYDYRELAGCGFVFKLPDESLLIPITMPDTLKHADLKLRIAFTEKQVANICMAGKLITLTYAEYVK